MELNKQGGEMKLEREPIMQEAEDCTERMEAFAPNEMGNHLWMELSRT